MKIVVEEKNCVNGKKCTMVYVEQDGKKYYLGISNKYNAKAVKVLKNAQGGES